VEDADLRDNPLNPHYTHGPAVERFMRLYTTDRPETQAVLSGFRKVVDEYDDRILIGEAYIPLEHLMAYYGANGDRLHLPFNFNLLSTPWRAEDLSSLVQRYEALLPRGGWPNWVLANHDRPRIASRVGPAQARVAAMLLLTLRGTPTLYYGDELGMTDVPIPPHLVQDPWEKNVPGFGLGRDPVRTPMPWSADHNAGFTHGQPWLPLGPDAATRNVAVQSRDADSLLGLYRALLRLRRAEDALAVGDYGRIAHQGDVLIYERAAGLRRVLICLNLSDRPASLAVPAGASLLLATHGTDWGFITRAHLNLEANAGVILQLPAEAP
jgi:alpha-glucosidase